MRKFALLTSVSVIALAFAQPAAAGEFADLCNEPLLTEDTEVKGVTETVNDDCTIILGDGVKLEIKNSDITVNGFLVIAAATTPTDNTASVEIKGTTFDVDEDFEILLEAGKVEIERDKKTNTESHIMAGSGMSIDTIGGKIEIKESNFHVDGTEFSIDITGVGGKVELKDNHFDLSETLSIDTDSGKIEVKGNELILDTGASLDVSSLSGDIEIKGNMGSITGDEGDGQITISSDTGDIEVKDNDIIMDGGELKILNDDGDIEVKDNDFGTPDVTRVETNGDCETSGNTPTLMCDLPPP